MPYHSRCLPSGSETSRKPGPLHTDFLDVEKAFDHASLEVIWGRTVLPNGSLCGIPCSCPKSRAQVRRHIGGLSFLSRCSPRICAFPAPFRDRNAGHFERSSKAYSLDGAACRCLSAVTKLNSSDKRKLGNDRAQAGRQRIRVVDDRCIRWPTKFIDPRAPSKKVFTKR